MPSGNIDKPIVEDNRDGTVSIRYDPREEGLHELALKYNGEHVQGAFLLATAFELHNFNQLIKRTQEVRSNSTSIPFLRDTLLPTVPV